MGNVETKSLLNKVSNFFKISHIIIWSCSLVFQLGFFWGEGKSELGPITEIFVCCLSDLDVGP